MKALLKNKAFIHSTAVLIGTMVGVGVFGIPFAFAKAGFWVGTAYLVLTGGITALMMLIYAELVLRTQEKHQLVGYVGIYAGQNARRIIFFTAALGFYGALLAYVIVSGSFLNNIFSHFFFWPQNNYSILFWGLSAVLVLIGLRTVANVELGLVVLYSAVILAIAALGAGKIDTVNYSGYNPAFWFLPYGVLLFAFGGLSSVPIQREILRGQEHLLKKSILTAIAVVAFLYLLFAFIVVGISGDVTSPESLEGLFDFLGPGIIVLGSVFGILAITTTFLTLGTALLDIFRLDFGIPRFYAWLLVILPPLVLFLAGQRNFIDVISLVGAVAVGLEPLVLLFAYRKARTAGTRTPEFALTVPKPVMILVGLVFATGAAYALFLR